MSDYKRVIVIFPHPDDETFGAGGTLASLVDAGSKVTYWCGTLGEMGRNMGNPVFANRETLSTYRKKELDEAAGVLGIDVVHLGYRDKTIEFEVLEEMVTHLRTKLEEAKPDLVITHFPGYAVHPDHDALGRAAVEAVKEMKEEERPDVWMHAISNETSEDLGAPAILKDISDYWDTKWKAIRTHLSQADGMVDLINREDQLERLKTERFYTLDQLQ
ncbi:bacillithiol biosynthesis deacetylase BshB2 [Salimicrobium halophilum]|uniref:Bacillithiol biosynthesis deacetylase BshB2 n=1 Tax=Salimicrobium halophilum TaxID=86666 RepID=A0A1G8V6Q8_9BACI|nr:bacillithiol biosynthesis deacetylase BshB2 [Salimicrobium halophilum]SDJ61015.1 bacillithiol biosynthesis deacetylase BshB2 [Salimicrobium halophilum]